MKKKINFFRRVIFLIFCAIINYISAQNDLTPKNALIKHKQTLLQNYQKAQEHNSIIQGQVDALYYKLELEILFDPNGLKGRVTNRYKSRVNNLNTLEIDLDDNMILSEITGPVTGFSHVGRKITVNLSRVFNEDEIIEITMSYSGVPDPGQNRWFVFEALTDGSDHVWTLSEPYGAKFWWPCKDTPADKADSVDIIVTVPENQRVASNGTLISDSDDGFGKRTFHWKESYPIATYLVSLAIAPYAHFTDVYNAVNGEDMLLDYYVYPENELLARAIFPETKDHLDALSYYFGPYPFINEKYGLAQFGWGGAMEHQTISSIYAVGQNWNYVYVHELGHQWFGDALTCATWTDIWLNEGFASYSEALYAEWKGYNNLPPGLASYQSYMLSQNYLEGGTIHLRDTTSVPAIFDRIVYDKGSWLLHMLRGALGDDDFFESLYHYANDSLKYTSVTSADFIKVCEEVSGKSLTRFFDQWLNYAYYPLYAVSWERTNNSVDISITQKQEAPLYEMPIDLKFIFSDNKDTTVTVFNYLRKQDYSIRLNDFPLRLLFDPENWILKNVEDLSAGDFTADVNILAIFPNPAREANTIIVKNWGGPDLLLNIYDVNGKRINRLKPYYQSGGHEFFFKWQGCDHKNQKVASGLYFVQPVYEGKVAGSVRKMLLLK